MDEQKQKIIGFEDLADVRARIDKVDDALLQKLVERAGLIEAVQAFKAKGGEGQSNAMRPARETQMLKRLIAKADGQIPAELILRLWRELVGWATQKQTVMKVHICAPRDVVALWDSTRAHFGGFAEIETHDVMHTVLEALEKSPQDVAVLPAGAHDISAWLGVLMAEGSPQAKIAGCLPLIGRAPEAYVLGTMGIEPTGDDRSLIYVVADPKSEHDTIKQAFDNIGLASSSIMSVDIQPLDGSKLWLVTCDEHFEQAANGLEQLQSQADINAAHFIGGYPALIDTGEGG